MAILENIDYINVLFCDEMGYAVNIICPCNISHFC